MFWGRVDIHFLLFLRLGELFFEPKQLSSPFQRAFPRQLLFLSSSSTMKTFTPRSTSSQNVPALHALALESGPHFLWRSLSSTVMIVGLLDDFDPPFVTLPPLVSFCVVDLDGVCGSLADLAGLHTDRLEVFSADHWLTSRGLPAECLGVLPHEAASSSNLPADTIGGP